MNKKYKELPAFGTNEFKAGDLLRVINGSAIFDVLITKIEADLLFLQSNKFNYEIAHFKQCRKLVEIEPRKFWIHKSSLLSISNAENDTEFIDNDNYIKVNIGGKNE